MIYITIRLQIYKCTSKCTIAKHPSNLPSKTEMVPSIFNQLLLQLDHRGKWHLYLLSFQLYCTVILMKLSTVFLKTLKTAYRSIPWLCAICILTASAVAGAQSKNLLVLSTISSNMPQKPLPSNTSWRAKNHKRKRNFECFTKGTIR